MANFTRWRLRIRSCRASRHRLVGRPRPPATRQAIRHGSARDGHFLLPRRRNRAHFSLAEGESRRQALGDPRRSRVAARRCAYAWKSSMRCSGFIARAPTSAMRISVAVFERVVQRFEFVHRHPRAVRATAAHGAVTRRWRLDEALPRRGLAQLVEHAAVGGDDERVVGQLLGGAENLAGGAHAVGDVDDRGGRPGWTSTPASG